MANSCSIIGRCRDRQTGKLTARLSQLHRDLLSIGKSNRFFNRQKANKAFYLSQNPKFLKEYDSELIFDSDAIDAEPKLASFYEIARQVLPEVTYQDIRDTLAKKFQEGVYSYEEARHRVIEFNKQMEGANTFMATLRPQRDGKYKFEITYNAIEEQNALMKVIANKEFMKIVANKLEAYTGYIEEDEKESMAKGILSIVKLKNKETITKEEADDAASAIIFTMSKDHPLISRLINALEKDGMLALDLIDQATYNEIVQLPQEEQAIRLASAVLSTYLQQNYTSKKVSDKLKGIVNLLSRIFDYIKAKVQLTNRDLAQAEYDSKHIAYKVVKEFMGTNFAGNLQLNRVNSTPLQDQLHDVLQLLDRLADRAKDWGFETSKNFKDTFAEIMTQYNEIGRLSREYKEQGISSIKDSEIQEETIKQLMKATRFIVFNIRDAQIQLTTAMSGVNPLSGGVLKDNEICKVIRKNEVLYQEAVNLEKQWKDIIAAYTSGQEDSRQTMREIQDLLATVLTGIPTQSASGTDIENVGYQALIHQARRKLATRLLAKVNGNQFLVIEQHVSMDGFLKIKRHKSTIVNLRDELLKTDVAPPLDYFSRWITAMLDSPSIINQLMATAIEQKKHEANVKALQAKDQLFNLYQKLRALGIPSTSIFMELDNDGDITGNIISERNWGQWEKNRKKAYKEWKEAWLATNKDQFLDISEAMHDNMFLQAKGSFLEAWHGKNSSKIPSLDTNGEQRMDEEGKPILCWAPAISSDENSKGKVLYAGVQYQKMQEDENQNAFLWLQEYMQLKKQLDALLPEGATNSYGVRAPQFQGTFTNKLHGAMGNSFTGEHIKRVAGTAFGQYVVQKLAENPSDTEYGGEHDTYEDDDLFYGNEIIYTDAHINAINSYKRVPLYGVRRLKNQYECSTDLIHSTLAYAAMAYNYSCLNDIIDEVEILRGQLRHQKVKSDETIADLQEKHKPVPGTYNRMVDYMNQQVYNSYAPTNSLKTYRFLRKAFGILTRGGSLYYLQWNIHSAITNIFTGFNEIVKEAWSGEEYDMKDFLFAFGAYIAWSIKAIGNNIYNFGAGIKDDGGHKGSINESLDKMNLFLREFDAENENQRYFRDYHIETPGYKFFNGYSYSNIAMFPYSATDKWMQAMAYIASAHHTKLVNKNGEEKSVWDAYTVKDGKLVLETIENDNGEQQDAEWKILDKNQQMLLDNFKLQIEADEVPKEYVPAVYEFENGELVTDDKGNKIVRSAYVPWDFAAQTLFKTKCRGINDRLHGVYNSNDGGAYLGSVFGAPIASLKKYAIGLIDRRFARGRYDIRSKTWRQGSTVTIANLLVDYMFSSDEYAAVGKISKSDKFLYKAGMTAANAIVGFGQFLCIVAASGAGCTEILKRRGYSTNQIANIKRFWADQILPELLRVLLYVVAPPDEQDKNQGSLLIKGLKGVGILEDRENKAFEDDPWLKELSEQMLKFYIGKLKFQKWMFQHTPLMPDTLTADDNVLLTEDYLNIQAMKYERSIPFSVKGMLYYQLYRVLLEQDAYNLSSPSSLYNLYSEYKNLTNSSIMGASALYDVVDLIQGLVERKTEEEIIEEAVKTGKKQYYSQDGQKIYAKGINRGFKKGTMHAIKTGLFRSDATYVFGYDAAKNMAFWRSRSLGLKEPNTD